MKILSLKKTDCRGMTLVEVMVVAVILSVVVMAVMSLFIPTVKSTAVQTELTDVQSNLRLAMNRMTDDLLTAGFLMGSEEPIINQTADTFTIQTRAVSNSFARVKTGTATVLTLADPEMINNFPMNSTLRLFNPMTATEIDGDQIYKVTGIDTTDTTEPIDHTITINRAEISLVDSETVIVRVKTGAPTTQTIRYTLESGTLVRTVNGDRQLLARGISALNLTYFPLTGTVHRVNITLTGETQDRGNDVLTETKTRTLQTSVTLRNVF